MGYDSHELGVEEFLERRLWRLLFPNWVRSLESRFIGRAEFVSTVSDGIADLLQDGYGLASRPTVISNVPAYQEAAFRPTGELIHVLYQGMLIQNRGLEPLIGSVARWRPELRLTIRGIGKESYVRRLRQMIAASPAAGRIDVAPPVAMVDMVEAASAADVGIHPLLETSNQTRYTLPNKLFEYLMAGMAVCVSDLPEMARVVRRHEVGVTIADPTPEGIADALNGLDRSTIDRCKQRALVAAKELCWEREQDRLLALVGP